MMAKELIVYKVRRGKGGTESADDYTIFYGKGNDNYYLGK
jgi:hypothetical protein